MSNKANRIHKLTLVTASVIVSIVLAEIALLLFYPQPVLRRVLADTPAMHVDGDVLPHVLKAGYRGRFRAAEFDTSISINGQGFRGPELKEQGEARIVVIGDSFTFGHGVDDSDTYPAILNTLLTPVEVINGGFAAGSSPDMYLAWLRAHGLELNASAYLIGFFIGNDVDRHHEMEWTEVDATGLPLRIKNVESYVTDNYLRPRATPIGYRYPILRESHLFHILGSAYRSVESSALPKAYRASIFDETYLPETIGHIERTKRVFYAISKWLDDHQIAFAVVMIPTIEQVLGTTSDKPQKKFSSYFQEIEVRYLDLLPTMKQEHESLYYPIDQHWNSRGHEVAAQQIARWLSHDPLIDR